MSKDIAQAICQTEFPLDPEAAGTKEKPTGIKPEDTKNRPYGLNVIIQ